MRRTVDKFGHYRGYHGGLGVRGPAGEGFVVDDDGNYNMLYKRLKLVGEPKESTDAATLAQFEDCDFNLKNIKSQLDSSEIPENWKLGINKVLNRNFNDRLVVWEKKIERLDALENKLEAALSESQNLARKIETVTQDALRSEKQIERMANDSKAEFKAVTDMTRDFVFKVTSPNYKRNSAQKEKEIKTKLQLPTSTWRHAFPEVSGV